MGSVFLIVNPVAGKLRARTALMDIIEIYSEAGLDVNVRATLKRGDAYELSRSARRDDYDKIVCVGGDGTLNEVICGLLESGEGLPLGYIPLGSTNDFANSLKLPKDPVASAMITLNGDICQLDVGDFNGQRMFSYIASFGMFTSASYSAPQSAKNTLGHFAYILEGIKNIKDIINIRSYALHIVADGESYDGEYVFGAIMNSTSIGGIVKLNSEIVDMSDGLFEIMLMRRIHNPTELSQVLLSLANSDFNNKMFDFIHASDIHIVSDTPISWSLDGEEVETSGDVRIRNMHKAISIYKEKQSQA